MYAIREIANVENNILKIHLPKDFPSDKAEIIIFPMDLKKKSNKKQKPLFSELIELKRSDYASQLILEERR